MLHKSRPTLFHLNVMPSQSMNCHKHWCYQPSGCTLNSSTQEHKAPCFRICAAASLGYSEEIMGGMCRPQFHPNATSGFQQFSPSVKCCKVAGSASSYLISAIYHTYHFHQQLKSHYLSLCITVYGLYYDPVQF